MTSRVITIEVFARRETRQVEQRVALLSPDGELSVWTCHRRIEVFRAAAVIREVVGQVGGDAQRQPPALVPAPAETTKGCCCGRAKSNGCQSLCEETVS